MFYSSVYSGSPFLSKGAVKIVLHSYSFCKMLFFISLFHPLRLLLLVQIFLHNAPKTTCTLLHSLYLHECVLKIILSEDIYLSVNSFDSFELWPVLQLSGVTFSYSLNPMKSPTKYIAKWFFFHRGKKVSHS